MTMAHAGLLTLVLVAAAVTPAMAQSPSPFSRAFDEFVHRDGTVGGSYLVLDQGRIIEAKNWGLADKEVKQPVDKDTLFHWASVTKTFTAVAIMQLRDRGKLSLDDPIIKYVPELTRVHSQDNQIARVTLRHLLSHTAGFQGPTWPYTEGRPWEPFEPTEWSQLVAMMPYQELAFAPGSKFSYSNPGFIYLARVIEALTGDPYQVYVQKNILTPLGMTRSYYNVTPYHLAEFRSNSYEVRLDKEGHESLRAFGREFDTGITTANGGLNAPLEDLAKWISFLSGYGPGSSGAHAVLARKSLEEMWRSVAPVETETYAPPASMGLSFFLFPRGSGEHAVTVVGHTGHQAGFQLFFVINPKNGRAVIAASNTVYAEGETPIAKQRYSESFQRFSHLMEEAITAIH
jgi:CubicO group peptidase (beta-lactamase class C family)